MAIPLWGTFDYALVVPSPVSNGPWSVQLGRPIQLTGNALDDRLVGHSPFLTISQAGIAEAASVSPMSKTRPRVLRSRLTLTARSKERAIAKSVSFHVDQALLAAVSAGDMLHMARTHSGGLALSIVRDGQLVAAAGAVSSIPLGRAVHVRIPRESIAASEAVFRKSDPAFEFPELPIEVGLKETVRLLYRGRLHLDRYSVFVEHGYYPGEPGIDECAALALLPECPDVVAIASAQLMDRGGALEIEKW